MDINSYIKQASGYNPKDYENVSLSSNETTLENALKTIRENINNPKTFIVIGTKCAKKTAFIIRLLRELAENGKSFYWIRSPIMEEYPERYGYVISDIEFLTKQEVVTVRQFVMQNIGKCFLFLESTALKFFETMFTKEFIDFLTAHSIYLMEVKGEREEVNIL